MKLARSSPFSVKLTFMKAWPLPFTTVHGFTSLCWESPLHLISKHCYVYLIRHIKYDTGAKIIHNISPPGLNDRIMILYESRISNDRPNPLEIHHYGIKRDQTGDCSGHGTPFLTPRMRYSLIQVHCEYPKALRRQNIYPLSWLFACFFDRRLEVVRSP